MKVGLGLKAHSGWAALVVMGALDGGFQVIDRRRIELVEEDSRWAKQPYHAAEHLAPNAGRDLVRRGREVAHRSAIREMRITVKRLREQGHEVAACAVLMANPMPDWSTDEILAVHFRMHKAEGVLFPDALARAADACGLRLIAILERALGSQAEKSLRKPLSKLTAEVMVLGKSVGAPWGRDQKSAALAAMVALV